MANLDAYWAMYDATLARIRNEKPDTFTALKAILDAFEPPYSGDAFFPGGADDDLADALHDAGWDIAFTEGVYVYTATHPATRAKVQHVEGDLYDKSPTRSGPTAPGARVALASSSDKHTRLQPNAMGTVLFTDDTGTVHVQFDTGETLGLIPGEDAWRALHPRWDVQRMTSTTDARRERGRLRDQLANLMQTDAPRAEVEPIRARIQQLNTQIQEQDGHQ